MRSRVEPVEDYPVTVLLVDEAARGAAPLVSRAAPERRRSARRRPSDDVGGARARGGRRRCRRRHGVVEVSKSRCHQRRLPAAAFR